MVIDIFVVVTVDVIVIDFCIMGPAWLDLDVALTCVDWLIYWLMMLDGPYQAAQLMSKTFCFAAVLEKTNQHARPVTLR